MSDSDIEAESDEEYDTDDQELNHNGVESDDDVEMEEESDDEKESLEREAESGDEEDENEHRPDLNSDDDEDIFHEYDSDDALQDAFQTGTLKPGLSAALEKTTKVYPNEVKELKQTLLDMKLSLPWVERLDLVNGLAPIQPEMSARLEETQQRRDAFIRNHNANKKNKVKLSAESDPVVDDFKRELNFHRQAQAAVLMGVPKLIVAGVMSKRPGDYFAEMAKSDEHMQKVRKVLMRKQLAAGRSEKAKKQRQNKKFAREREIATKLKKINEKREMLEEVKKFRKGIRKDLDFLDDKKVTPKKAAQKAGPVKKNKKAAERAFQKNKRFGFGGKKSGSKRNTSASTMGIKPAKGRQQKRGKFGGRPGGEGGKQQRPGKSKRQQNKR